MMNFHSGGQYTKFNISHDQADIESSVVEGGNDAQARCAPQRWRTLNFQAQVQRISVSQ